jgi:hypothetical protein
MMTLGKRARILIVTLKWDSQSKSPSKVAKRLSTPRSLKRVSWKVFDAVGAERGKLVKRAK